MTAVALSTLLLLLPFPLSLAAQGAIAKLLCAVESGLALLLSVEPYATSLPQCVGMAIAVISAELLVSSGLLILFRLHRFSKITKS